ncbi:MAG TPA: type II toxin-antitoxin system RatA family toxin [Usitatibacteraceae bacterium]|nr:type II toxin-antitoxin system RatA family toxin [Usitatibacteraceae bacterium]
MPIVTRNVIVDRPADAMFVLVDRVEDYPRFLPWCSGVEVFERTSTLTHARIDIDFHGIRMHVATRNRNERPEWIHLELADGPFERLAGHWHIRALGEEGCAIEFSIDYAFSSRALERLMGPVFGQFMETIVDRFVERAAVIAKSGPGQPAVGGG